MNPISLILVLMMCTPSLSAHFSKGAWQFLANKKVDIKNDNIVETRGLEDAQALEKKVHETEEKKQQTGQKAIEKEIKAISSTVADPAGDTRINFAFARLSENSSMQTLFLAANDVGPEKESFSVARAAINEKNTPMTLDVFGLTPDDSPLNGAQISNFLLFTSLNGVRVPVVTKANDIDDQGARVYAIPNLIFGENPTISEFLLDAGGAAANQNVRALAGTGSNIFAAVPASGQFFGTGEVSLGAVDVPADNRGVAVLSPSAGLASIIVNPDNPRAIKIQRKSATDASAATARHTAFYSGAPGTPLVGALFEDNVAMHWDTTLQRLYIGLDRVRRDDAMMEGGCMALLMGRFDGASFVIEPVLHQLKKAHLYAAPNVNVDDTIVGFYADGESASSGNEPFSLSIKKIVSMQTSTGKTYLIVHGSGRELLTSMLNKFGVHGIFALPLQGKTNAAGNEVAEAQRGTIATSNFSGPVTTLSAMHRAADPRVRVGSEPSALLKFTEFSPDSVTDLFVEGDSVYVCLNGNNSLQIGMYQSTALFDKDGNIFAWTPWVRVAGSAERMFAGARSSITGDYFFVGEDLAFDHTVVPAPAQIGSKVKVSQWGRSDVVDQSDPSNNLSEVLETIFPQNEGGVYQFHMFDQQTRSFEEGQISFLVALGKGKVALIKTGQYDAALMNFYPVTQFSTSGANQNVFVFQDEVLSEIGPLCAAAISEDNTVGQARGFLFVGGYKGVAVLSNAANEGFTMPLTDLTASGYPGIGATFSFKKILNDAGAINDVRAIRVLQDGIFFVTRTHLYFINSQEVPLAVDQDTIKALPAIATDFAIISKSGIPSLFILATIKGLFVSHDFGATWQEVAVGEQTGRAIVQLFLLSDRADRAALNPKANVFVLTGDRAIMPTEGKVYQFAANLQAVTLADKFAPIKFAEHEDGAFVDFKEFRGNIFTDGTILYNSRGKHFGDTQFINNVPIRSKNPFVLLTGGLSISEQLNYNIGVPVRESASGALLVPGDWGVRVNL